MTDRITIKFKNSTVKTDAWGTLTCSNTISGKELIQQLAQQCSLNPSEIRCLLQGKYLKEDLSLAEQKVSNNSRLLIMKGASEEKKIEIQQKEQKDAKAQRIIKAAESVANRTNGGESGYDQTYFEVQNEHGAQLQLDPEDRKALVKGMTLHEKGSKMLDKDLETALKFLLESDAAFQQVKDPQLMEKIDNYAILCMDICWAYLKSKNKKELKENSWRLTKAHELLKKAYGENNERLVQLRGGCCPELVVYVRLFLLQAILTFDAGSIEKAKQLVSIAEEKLAQMTITEDDMMPLLQMGFTLQEARIGLRAANKSKHDATQWILTRREKKEEQRRADKQKARESKRQRKIGKTAKGHWVNVKLLDALVALGYSEDLTGEALKQADNDQELAINLLTTNPELLKIAIDNARPFYVPTEAELMNIISMGFAPEQAFGTLKLSNGNLERAIELLLNGQGVSEPVPDIQPAVLPAEPPAEAPVPMETEEPDPEKLRNEEQARIEKELEAEAENELVGAHVDDDIAHLDIDLTEEHELLNQYKTLILSRPQ